MAVMDKMILVLTVLLYADDVCSQNTPNNNFDNTSNLYGIINQWTANFDPDLIVSVWSKMSSVEGLEDQNNSCSAGLLRIVEAYNNNDIAAARYFDSWGKPGTAILQGNVAYWGSYDECIDLKDTSILETDYCRFHFHVKINNASIPLQVGLCFPSVCSVSEFIEVLNSSLAQANELIDDSDLLPISVEFIVDPNKPLCPWRDLDYDAGTIVVLVVCIIIVTLVLLGSLVDGLLWYYEEWLIKPNLTDTKIYLKDNQNFVNSNDLGNIQNKNRNMTNAKLKEFLLCFSLYKTCPEILATHHPTGATTCLNGMRVISILWILLGHTSHYGLKFQIVKNLLYTQRHTYTRFTFQVITGGTYKAVDTFFLLSGLLLTYLSLREMERHKGKLPLAIMYIFRFVRISPLYYFEVFFWFKILPHMGYGPNWYWRARHNCDEYWWTNLLYINNFYPRDMEDSCLSVAWYLAVDMQLFIFTPIFLYLLYHYWRVGVAALLCTLIASWVATGIIVGVNDYGANIAKQTYEGEAAVKPDNVFRDVYQTPHCRAGAYIVGILFGFILHKKWEPPKSLRICIPFYGILWIVGIVCTVTPVYGLYHTFHGHTLSTFENVMYLA